MEIYGVYLRIQSECGKIEPEKLRIRTHFTQKKLNGKIHFSCSSDTEKVGSCSIICTIITELGDGIIYCLVHDLWCIGRNLNITGMGCKYCIPFI